MIRKLTNSSDLNKTQIKIKTFKKFLKELELNPKADPHQLIQDQIVILEQKESLLKKYPGFDYRRIMKNLEAFEEKEEREFKLKLTQKYPDADPNTIIQDLASGKLTKD